ncbi:hypothetical protein V8J82_14640 [Gymnodinialimonas sp. 2305UL16-5]|uniref:hypothetical protein n=1 Tax=Gymnodinialimonas mytili TaxID=3126503 RepID=UPI0030B5F939
MRAARRRVLGLTGTLSLIMAALAPQAGAIEIGTPAEPQAERAICDLPLACRIGAGCARMPTFGTLILVIDQDGTWMGRSDTQLERIDRVPSLEDAASIPEQTHPRREFLVDLPRLDLTDRYGLYTQIRDQETGEVRLQTQYFVMHCREAAP